MNEQNTQQQKSYKILLIGDDCLDVYQYGTVDRISPEAPVPVFKYAHKEERGGMARNVKLNLEALGCDVTYYCGSTSIKTRLIDSRSKQHIIRIDNDVSSIPLDFNDLNYNLAIFDAVVISDYDKGYVSYELVEKLIANFKGIVFIDTKKVDLARFQGAYVKINRLEYSKLKSECTGLIVTLGDEGATCAETNFPAPVVEVNDVTGAGDTFLAALTYKWCETQNLGQCIRFAIQASSITVQHLGVYAPTLKEIE